MRCRTPAAPQSLLGLFTLSFEPLQQLCELAACNTLAQLNSSWCSHEALQRLTHRALHCIHKTHRRER